MTDSAGTPLTPPPDPTRALLWDAMAAAYERHDLLAMGGKPRLVDPEVRRQHYLNRAISAFGALMKYPNELAEVLAQSSVLHIEYRLLDWEGDVAETGLTSLPDRLIISTDTYEQRLVSDWTP